MKIPHLSKLTGVKSDTLYRAKNGGHMSRKLALKLEQATGIKRLQWLYPDEYGDPWKLLEDI